MTQQQRPRLTYLQQAVSKRLEGMSRAADGGADDALGDIAEQCCQELISGGINPQDFVPDEPATGGDHYPSVKM